MAAPTRVKLKKALRRAPAVKGMAGENGKGAVNLLGQHCPHHEMRPGLRPESEPLLGAFAQCRRQAIGSAYQKGNIANSPIPKRGEVARESLARKPPALLVQCNAVCGLGNPGGQFGRFGLHPRFGRGRAGGIYNDKIEPGKSELGTERRRPLPVKIAQCLFRRVTGPADSGDSDTHPSAERTGVFGQPAVAHFVH